MIRWIIWWLINANLPHAPCRKVLVSGLRRAVRRASHRRRLRVVTVSRFFVFHCAPFSPTPSSVSLLRSFFIHSILPRIRNPTFQFAIIEEENRKSKNEEEKKNTLKKNNRGCHYCPDYDIDLFFEYQLQTNPLILILACPPPCHAHCSSFM